MKRILFRFDVSNKVGFGHLIRCVSLSEELKKKKFKIFFSTNKYFKQTEFFSNEKSILFIKIENNKKNEEIKLFKYIIKKKISCVFFDIKKNYSRNFFSKLKKNKIKTITIDDKFNKRILCDLCFYPPVPQIDKMSWKNFKGKRYAGWEYVPLRKQFKYRSKKKPYYDILIMSGGANKELFSIKILKMFLKFDNKLNININFGFKAKFLKKIDQIISKTKHNVTIEHNNLNIKKSMERAFIIFTTFGVTAYEIASLGKASIIYSKKKNDQISASIFNHEKISFVINNLNKLNEKNIQKYINQMKQKYSKNSYAISKKLSNGSKKIANIIFKNV